MTNQINKAFEKWKNSFIITTGCYPNSESSWKAATKVSEIEINSLKERVAELQSHLARQSLDLAHNYVTLESYAHKVAELQADNNQLRETLETISDWRFGWEGDCGVTSVANNAISSTPAQSLAEHDKALIERIALALENAEGEFKTLPEYVALVRGMKNE